MSMFSQSLMLGDDTLGEIERNQKVERPPESMEIIEESPTASLASRSRVVSIRHQTTRKSRAIKRSKSDSILNGRSGPEAQGSASKQVDTYSQLFRSELDFDFKENVLPDKSGRPTGNTQVDLENYFDSMDFNCDGLVSQPKQPTQNHRVSIVGNAFESSDFFTQLNESSNENAESEKEMDMVIGSQDMAGMSFGECSFPVHAANETAKSPVVACQDDLLWDECSFTVAKQANDANKTEPKVSQNICWEDSADFGDAFNTQLGEQIPPDSAKDDKEELAVCIDNVTFTQEMLVDIISKTTANQDESSDPPSISNFIEGEMNKCQKQVSLALAEDSHLIEANTLIMDLSSTSNIVLNYSAESIPIIPSAAKDICVLDTAPEVNSPKTSNRVLPSKNLNQIDQWGLSDAIVQQYHRKGIRTMFDWQVECLSNAKVILEGANLVYSAPTSAGKTLVSELLMVKTVLERKKKSLMILPFISVVREKMFYLQELLSPAEINVEGFFGGYYPPFGINKTDIAICTIEKANSIVNKLLESQKIESIGCIVVDEIHLISDPGRGYILELLLAKILYVCRRFGHRIQIVTMSATLPNLELLTKWLDAEFYRTDFRPVALMEMLKVDGTIYDSSLNEVRKLDVTPFAEYGKDQDGVGQMCVETILEGCSVIVFCPSKDWCESLSTHVAGFVYSIGKSKSGLSARLRPKLDMEAIEEVKAQLRNCATGLDAVLEKCISYGCAFHHAGLTTDERDIVESAFKAGILKVIVATSTLSSGVNLPARRVIIRSPMFGGKMMNALTYKQMIGRAGRTGKDTLGESILVCSTANSKNGKELVCAKLTPLSSCLDIDSNANLKRAILEIIASGMASSKSDLEAFTNSTLLASERNICFSYAGVVSNDTSRKDLNSRRGNRKSTEALNESSENPTDPISSCINFLIKYEFIRCLPNEDTGEMNFVSTRLGNACLASSMPPGDGFLLFSELQKSRQNFVLESELHAVYLVTPFSVCYQLHDIDWLLFLDMWEKLPSAMRRVGEMVGVKESFLVKAMRSRTLDYKALQVHKRFYTAMALQELVNETNINVVAAKYKCSRGLLQSLQQMASTFAEVVTSFCHALNWSLLALIISQFKERLFFGVHRDLIDLMRIQNLNGHRARTLFDAGVKTLVDLANANVLMVERILYDSISFDAKQRDGETDFDAEKRNKIRFLHMTGKAGSTIQETAEVLIDEARRYLESELGLQNVRWSGSKSKEKEDLTVDPVSQVVVHPEVVVKPTNEDGQINSNRISESEDIFQLKSPPKHESPGTERISNKTSNAVIDSEDIFEVNSEKSPIRKRNSNNLLTKVYTKHDKVEPPSKINVSRIEFVEPQAEPRQSGTRTSPRIQSKANVMSSTNTVTPIKNTPKAVIKTPNSHRESDCEIIQTPVQTQRNRSRLKARNTQTASRTQSRPPSTPLVENPMQNQLIDVNDFDSIGFSRSHNSSSSIHNASHIMSVIKQDEDCAGDVPLLLDKIQIINVCGDVGLFQKFQEAASSITEVSLSIAVDHNMPSSRQSTVIGGNLLNDHNAMDDSVRRKRRNCVFDEGTMCVKGVALCLDDTSTCFYMNMQEDVVPFGQRVEFIETLCGRSNLTLRIYDAKEQCKVLRKSLPTIKEIVARLEDPRIANWMLQPEEESGLLEMAKEFAPECTSLCQLGGNGKHNGSIGLNYISEISPRLRASIECCITGMILAGQKENLNRLGSGDILKSFIEMEMPIQHSLFLMEIAGLPVDPDALNGLDDQINVLMKRLEGQMFKMHGRRFNVASSGEVAKVLNMRGNANGGKISTSKAVLSKMTDDPMSVLIMQWRQLSMALTKTLRPIQRNMYKKRIHGNSFSFTSTGRISMQEPNVQNVAKDFVIQLEDVSTNISCRSIFRCLPKRALLSADFCQLELRILCHLSQDPVLLKLMNSNRDVFTTISANWNRVDENMVTEKQRNETKHICYGIIYGMGVRATAETLKCTEDDARHLIDSFHQSYPGIRAYTERIVRFARSEGYIETLAGRRRYLVAINAEDSAQRSQAERQAINTTIQGSAADVAKYAILRMERNVRKYERTLKINVAGDASTRVDLVLHLHDELIYEVPADKLRSVAKILRSSMENCAKMNVPLLVKIKSGACWGDMTVMV